MLYYTFESCAKEAPRPYPDDVRGCAEGHGVDDPVSLCPSELMGRHSGDSRHCYPGLMGHHKNQIMIGSDTPGVFDGGKIGFGGGALRRAVPQEDGRLSRGTAASHDLDASLLEKALDVTEKGFEISIARSYCAEICPKHLGHSGERCRFARWNGDLLEDPLHKLPRPVLGKRSSELLYIALERDSAYTEQAVKMILGNLRTHSSK